MVMDEGSPTKVNWNPFLLEKQRAGLPAMGIKNIGGGVEMVLVTFLNSGVKFAKANVIITKCHYPTDHTTQVKLRKRS